uniref:Uncharacterized protein n=1 Tax=Chromera velia CCMP2878 TaxID=1169474 RepID=A0A0K6S8C3_9ALVE|eukprot:Cvel_25316.t2-p1 / transcript=Cvel_25316.t2 / gene=Cvel_25316 / organism=Chromera_velia_CCMP2878 / gene_product=hypothetical protein / transcript_product=hypothetical protein / location=Cvel_scaffold2850:16602-18080(+) / protein_length=125 / sequence_SO=supercontig / SO=protein_coding / is_pseudo=false
MFGRLLAGGEISMRHEAKSLDEWLRTFRSAALRGALTLGRGEAPRNGVAEKAYELFKNCRASVPQAKEGRTVKILPEVQAVGRPGDTSIASVCRRLDYRHHQAYIEQLTRFGGVWKAYRRTLHAR